MLLFARECPFVIDGALVLNGIAVVAKAAEMALDATPPHRVGGQPPRHLRQGTAAMRGGVPPRPLVIQGLGVLANRKPRKLKRFSLS